MRLSNPTCHRTFKKLDRRRCNVMLSNSDTPFHKRDIYGDFKEYLNQVNAPRAINYKVQMC